MEKKRKRSASVERKGHKGNNGLKGKPSNNLGHKRASKVPRRSKLDMEIKALVEAEQLTISDSDVEEELNHMPLNIHFYRSAFIKYWCSRIVTEEIHEDSIVQTLLENNSSNCIFTKGGNLPPVATVDHLRKKIKVRGKFVSLPKIKREGDRNIRPYHLWMYNSGRWTREQLSIMERASNSAGDTASASHICGGDCLNHAIPESNSLNQQRKKHHNQMKAALAKGLITEYIRIRAECNHNPKCFINPEAHRLTGIIKEVNLELYNAVLQAFE
jgi:hypothetical protein